MAKSIASMVSYRIKRAIAWVIAMGILGLMGFGAYYLVVEVL